MSEQKIPVDHIITLSELRYALSQEWQKDKQKIQKEILTIIEQNNMYPYYKMMVENNELTYDENFAKKLKQNNDEKLKTLDEKIADAKENLGESEVREALLAKALFFKEIGDKENAIQAFDVADAKTVSIGQRIDIVFELLRIGFGFSDLHLTKKNIEKAKNLIEEGGDWERRNRLKVYEGTYQLVIRNFKGAAQQYLESISTFSTYEFMTYEKFITYTVIVSMLALERPALKKKIVDSSDVLSVIRDIPKLHLYLNSLYTCQYQGFLTALVDVTDLMEQDRFLAPHAQYYSREMRILAYTQFLESYKSVKLSAMAHAFGITEEFLDIELSRFISAGRIHCKIDKVGGIVETNRPDLKNAQYQAIIKQGDSLLNRIQNLSRIIDL